MEAWFDLQAHSRHAWYESFKGLLKKREGRFETPRIIAELVLGLILAGDQRQAARLGGAVYPTLKPGLQPSDQRTDMIPMGMRDENAVESADLAILGQIFRESRLSLGLRSLGQAAIDRIGTTGKLVADERA